jgi:hypothetical protein
VLSAARYCGTPVRFFALDVVTRTSTDATVRIGGDFARVDRRRSTCVVAATSIGLSKTVSDGDSLSALAARSARNGQNRPVRSDAAQGISPVVGIGQPFHRPFRSDFNA